MRSVFDVAALIVERLGTISPMKLQKLAYYTQAWSLVRDGQPAFEESFEAWRNGPVCRPLYDAHSGEDFVPYPYLRGDVSSLGEPTLKTIEAVLLAYGPKSSQWLSALTHRELPWLAARAGLGPDERSSAPIPREVMYAYYSSAESAERRIVVSYGKPVNRFVQFMEDMDDDDASIVDELAKLDLDPEVAKLTV